MSDEIELGMESEGPSDLPRVVEEAYDILGAYHLKLGGLAVGLIAAWVGSLFLTLGIPLSWLLIGLGILFGLAVSPVTREPRLARDVLRRWDALRIDRAFASSGIASDPRLEVAESMAERILRHPSSDERIRSATSATIRRLRRLLDDLKRTSYLARAQAADERVELSRSVSDLQDSLDARVAEVLGQLAELHRTVVLRDTGAIERVVGQVEALVRELEAEVEVERLLSSAEKD